MKLNIDKLKQLMAIKEWTEAHTAVKIGMATQQFNSIMRGKGTPSLKTIEKIAKPFGISGKALIKE